MRKALSVLLAVSACVSSLVVAGCGSGGADPDETAAEMKKIDESVKNVPPGQGDIAGPGGTEPMNPKAGLKTGGGL